jgi:hypothetical protein
MDGPPPPFRGHMGRLPVRTRLLGPNPRADVRGNQQENTPGHVHEEHSRGLHKEGSRVWFSILLNCYLSASLLSAMCKALIIARPRLVLKNYNYHAQASNGAGPDLKT